MKANYFYFALLICLIPLSGCKKIVVEPEFDEDNIIETPDWGAATHEKQDPVYEAVFPEDQVKRIDITLSNSNWNKMQLEIKDQYGDFGNQQIVTPNVANDFLDNDFTPSYFPCNVLVDGINWYKVGMRFKGNSSLQEPWNNGSFKLPFKLHFDKFEDEYPQIKNQRFYGFKKISFNNNNGDPSAIKEVVANQLYREYGLPVPRMSFYEVYIDSGSGPVYFGIYTAIENADDTFIKNQFVGSKNNLYKPSGLGATFDAGTFSPTYFPKKANSSDLSFADVEGLYNHIHSTERINNPPGWRYDLEKMFDLNTFVKWLGINTLIQNWDAYGLAAHNYYLYHDPETNKLVWIPTDQNQAFTSNSPIGDVLELDLSNVDERWALIDKIMSDPNYYARYKHFMKDFASGPFHINNVQQIIDEKHQLIANSVANESLPYSLHDLGAFTNAVPLMKAHCSDRFIKAQQF